MSAPEPPPQRPIDAQYHDPLDLVWLRCARECGLEVVRTSDAYASFDPARRRLLITTSEHFDPDDSLAQLVLHELCHALVAGPDGMTRPDFGLENVDDRDLVSEHATQRLQAHLADRWGLRALLAVTTQWRPYWNRLPKDPLAPGDDPAIAIARAARERADAEPWAGALKRALMATQVMADLVRADAPEGSLWRRVSPRVHERHALGSRLGPPGTTCDTCAWLHASHDGHEGRHGPETRCLFHQQGMAVPPLVRRDASACVHWEPRLDADACGRCGACCREAFHLVPLDADEPLVGSRPDLVTHDPQGHSPFYIARPFGACRALERAEPPYRCSVYAERPRSCRDFAVGSANCLEARRRVGLAARP
ncbi:MAG: YkgJ family cysteine cluster protein [Deltaproteobacteria bacterium]|nr:YkgJ family cysteine cluster protein [Deltaproteobacteria bacterium]